ncbi:phosphoglycerate kinase [Candidatus Persebacteraceae bacterium Df01]|jgi:phosphoglycerate kinase|uniref:Phosphoglycerate kinase n=1 Tax=Candidatus Doriopsillibacter californiensis TaxID=2970740 RepID=A0ABT7QM14_9GAMM|nr:phosphoglycerate kinase [Candidatus Persebacteraceae bacterium Df01]
MSAFDFYTLTDINWHGKIALLRADFNVPMVDGNCTDDTRIRAALPTIHHILENGGGVLCLSHLGRPRAGEPNPARSLAPVAAQLQNLISQDVVFCRNWPTQQPPPGAVWMLENTRFNVGEKENSPDLAARYATLGDVFVMDAFATAHRAEASTSALAQATSACCAGLLLQAEVEALKKALFNPTKPVVAVVGGAKVSTKLAALNNLMQTCDYLIAGGGIANTLLLAEENPIGNSLAEHDMLGEAKKFLSAHADKTLLPEDVTVVDGSGENIRVLRLSELSDIGDGRIVDVGPAACAAYGRVLAKAGTIIWNGPLGWFEQPPFSAGTRALAAMIAASPAYSLAGGGDTLAAVAQSEVKSGISYLSTGGGAFLQFIEGSPMPGLASVLKR